MNGVSSKELNMNKLSEILSKIDEYIMKLIEIVVWCIGWLYRLVLKTLEFLNVITNKIISVVRSLIGRY